MEQITISISEIFGWSIGISTLVAVAFGALWSIGFNRIKEGQKAEIQKQIETKKAEFSKEIEYLKAKNDKCNYITKTQFDVEFKIYQELLDILSIIINDLYSMSNLKTINKNDEPSNEKYNNLISNINNYYKCLIKNAAFINDEIYQFYSTTYNKLSNLINNGIKNYDYYYELSNIKQEIEKVVESKTSLDKKIRKYLTSLKILKD